jgi:transcriptional regulator with XRE-family HTH domain
MSPIKRPIRRREGTYLREWRETMNPPMSQAEAARRIGRDHSSLQRLEKGLIPYNQDWLELLAALYGCKPEDLISRDPRSSKGYPLDTFRDYHRIPVEAQQQFKAIARSFFSEVLSTHASSSLSAK